MKAAASARIGIWLRVSTEDQAKGESLEHHEERARGYAGFNDWAVVEVYRLDGVSGKAVWDHPEAVRMRNDVAKGHIDTLIFSKLARLARSTRELLDFAEYFEEHGANLVSLQEKIDTSTPAGRLFYTIIGAMAQWEREEISDRVKASIPIRAKLGKSIGGQAPLGYQWKDNHLIPNSEEAPVRTLIYELFREHKRKATVARILNERGYRTRRGAKFTDVSVERLIRDTTAKGVRTANHTTSVDGGKSWVPKPRSEWVTSEVPAIITAELWDQCNAILDGIKQSNKRTRKGKKAVHVFAGYVYCHCGHKMYVLSNSPKYVCQKCRNKIHKDDLDKLFYKKLSERMLDPERIAEYLNDAQEEQKSLEAQLQNLRKETLSLKREIDSVFQLFNQGHLTGDEFADRHTPLSGRVSQINEEIPRIESALSALKVQEISTEQIKEDITSLYNRWPNLDDEHKMLIVESTVDQIIIHEKRITFKLLYHPALEKIAKSQRDHPVSEEADTQTPPGYHRYR